jgi:hypothetical protein
VQSQYGQFVPTERFMKLPLTVLAVALALPLAACTSDLGPGPLSGNWGGSSMLVQATPAGIIMTLGCGAIVRISHGVVLDSSGAFSVLDSLRGSLDGAERDTLPGRPVVPALVSGQLSGDVLSVALTLDLPTPEAPVTTGAGPVFVGRRGQPAVAPACPRT